MNLYVFVCSTQLISRHEFHKFSKTKKCAMNIKDDEMTKGGVQSGKDEKKKQNKFIPK